MIVSRDDRIMKLHVNWGRASASQLKRILVDSEGGNSYSVNFVDDVGENCDVRKAFEKAPYVPIAGATAVSMFNEKVQVGPQFSDDLIALHAMDICPTYSPLTPAQSKNPQKAWDAF